MYITVVGKKAFGVCVVEVGAVVNGRLLGGGATEDAGPPCISGNDEFGSSPEQARTWT